jgi:hypothetical protein
VSLVVNRAKSGGVAVGEPVPVGESELVLVGTSVAVLDGGAVCVPDIESVAIPEAAYVPELLADGEAVTVTLGDCAPEAEAVDVLDGVSVPLDVDGGESWGVAVGEPEPVLVGESELVPDTVPVAEPDAAPEAVFITVPLAVREADHEPLAVVVALGVPLAVGVTVADGVAERVGPPRMTRTRRCRLSATKTALSVERTTTAVGFIRVANAAGPPSRRGEKMLAIPKTVEMMFVALFTKRTTYTPKSEIKTFPLPSTATYLGVLSFAAVASPPSPELPDTPVPAIVVITPVDRFTMRTDGAAKPAMRRFPLLSSARPCGEEIFADVAGPSSPEYPDIPDAWPAKCEIMPVSSESTRTRWFAVSEMYNSPRASSSARPEGAFSSAAVPAPPSPVRPAPKYVPASVLVSPVDALATRTRCDTAAEAPSEKKMSPFELRMSPLQLATFCAAVGPSGVVVELAPEPAPMSDVTTKVERSTTRIDFATMSLTTRFVPF